MANLPPFFAQALHVLDLISIDPGGYSRASLSGQSLHCSPFAHRHQGRAVLAN